MSWERESLESRFDDMLDECYEPFTMGTMIFMPSDILKSCDPVAYRCSVADFEDSEEEEEEEETHPRDEHDVGLSCDLCEESDHDPFEDLDTYTRNADWEMEERGL